MFQVEHVVFARNLTENGYAIFVNISGGRA